MTAIDRALSWFLEPSSPESPRDTGVPHGSPLDGSGGDIVAAAARPAGAARAPEIGAAAVLGRPGQAEPVAAALALVLSRGAPARSATVAVIGRENPAEPPPASGGTRAARRLAARLDAHGLAARPRGRLVWVAVPPDGRVSAARRIALVGAPAVLAIGAPRTPDIEELLAEQDLLVLAMTDPGGPLARVAALAPGGVPVAVTRPLTRGPARSLALAGLRAPRTVREVVAATAAARQAA